MLLVEIVVAITGYTLENINYFLKITRRCYNLKYIFIMLPAPLFGRNNADTHPEWESVHAQSLLGNHLLTIKLKSMTRTGTSIVTTTRICSSN